MVGPGDGPAASVGFASAEELVCGPASILFRVSSPRGGQAALKVFRLSGTPEDQAYARTRMPADWRIWSELAHPHVLPVSDYGEGNDSLYVATRWVDGPSLRAALDQRRTLEAAQVRRLAQQLASALDAVAAAGLVHLDVKPENVLFASDGMEHAYVRDFGAGRLAAWKAGLGRAGAVGEYAAPEQIEGDAVDGRTLVYSLGCLLYEALTGAPPYAGASSTALMPPVAGHVFAIALAQRRDERYATCADFADALDAALASLPLPRPARRTGRRPVVTLRRATVAAFAAFVAAAAATAASWLAQGAPGASSAVQDKPFSNSAFIASLPKADPAVKAARKQIVALPSVTRVSTRKAASPKPHRAASTSPAPVSTGAAPTSTSGTAPIAPPSRAAAPRRSTPAETTTTVAAPGLPLPPPPPTAPPPQDSTPPLPPPPP